MMLDFQRGFSLWIFIWHILSNFVSAWFSLLSTPNAFVWHCRVLMCWNGRAGRAREAKDSPKAWAYAGTRCEHRCNIGGTVPAFISRGEGWVQWPWAHDPVSHHRRRWVGWNRFDTSRPCRISLSCGRVNIQSWGARYVYVTLLRQVIVSLFLLTRAVAVKLWHHQKVTSQLKSLNVAVVTLSAVQIKWRNFLSVEFSQPLIQKNKSSDTAALWVWSQWDERLLRKWDM